MRKYTYKKKYRSCNTKRKRRSRSKSRSKSRRIIKKGGNNNNILCVMCNRIFPYEECFIPRECYSKHGLNPSG